MGMKDAEQSAPPGVIPGLESLMASIMTQTQGPTNLSTPFGQGEQNFYGQMQGLDIPGFLQSGFGALQGIAQGGLYGGASPYLGQMLDQGLASVNENAANIGVLSSSGNIQNANDFTQNTVNQLATTLAPLQLGAAQSLASPATAGIGGQAFGAERAASDAGLDRGLIQQGNALQALGSMFYQPQFGPSALESMMGGMPGELGAKGADKARDGKGGGGKSGGGNSPDIGFGNGAFPPAWDAPMYDGNETYLPPDFDPFRGQGSPTAELEDPPLATVNWPPVL